MAHLAPPSPPLLVTKPLTSFLHDNLSAPLHTAALTTSSGRLLVHASRSSPARVLRRQCAVAASVWALRAESRRSEAKDATPPAPSPVSKATTLSDTPVTVVLTGGVVVVILSLRCGILLVTIGGSQEHQPGSAAQAAGPATPGVGALSARAIELLQGQGNGSAAGGSGGASSPPLGSPSEAESVLSGGTGAASNLSRAASSAGGSSGGVSTAKTKLAVRRQTEALALLLDEKLGLLELPEETNGSSSDAR